MTDEHLLAVITGLLETPFPNSDVSQGDRDSAPAHHLQVLRRTDDFWEDRAEERYEAAEREIEAARQPLVAALTARWGTPMAVDLTPSWRDSRTLPEPLDRLSQVSGEVLVWWPAGTERWVGLAVGQADNEFPIELIAAVGIGQFPVTVPGSPQRGTNASTADAPRRPLDAP
ncbi:hypothetical protein [Plantactinospora sonchi]|uniref:Uncharacterized protein n=1 Tax=Plantactinospora sonchi TaxID=1544735 RepID=A0ABU7RNH0_9ACTN